MDALRTTGRSSRCGSARPLAYSRSHTEGTGARSRHDPRHLSPGRPVINARKMVSRGVWRPRTTCRPPFRNDEGQQSEDDLDRLLPASRCRLLLQDRLSIPHLHCHRFFGPRPNAAMRVRNASRIPGGRPRARSSSRMSDASDAVSRSAAHFRYDVLACSAAGPAASGAGGSRRSPRPIGRLHA